MYQKSRTPCRRSLPEHMTPKYEITGETTSDVLMYDSKPMLNSRITLPKMRTSGANVNYIKFNYYYSNLASKLRNKARLEMYPAAVDAYDSFGGKEHFFEHSLSVTYKTGMVGNMICSITTTETVYAGGANSFEEMKSQNWLVYSGYLLKAKEFFKPVCNWQEIIYKQICREAEQKAGEGLLFEDWRELLKSNLDWNNFYITDDAFIVFFPLFTIAPHVSGIIEFSVPLAKLGYCIRDEFQKKAPRGDCGCESCSEGGIIPPFELPPLYR